MSSPPARGCSQEPPDWSMPLIVVPARAGVFRRSLVCVLSVGCRPRPRGGVPRLGADVARLRTSSPPARGCSAGRGAGRGGDDVVPARAGVFLLSVADPPAAASRPRPRGGVPAANLAAGDLRMSSPPARGCSTVGAMAGDAVPVVPACAGVFRPDPVPARPLPGRPRPRGGVPSSRNGRAGLPARGCSDPATRWGRHTLVVPARAGVFLRGRRTRTSALGRPRPRGGVPAVYGWRSREVKSSPPARGCSPRLGTWVDGENVVPARAGVFRGPCVACGAPRRRPRPRGGVPVGRRGLHTTRSSSPPARGCSDDAGSVDGPDRVVPARAGVFPGAAA